MQTGTGTFAGPLLRFFFFFFFFFFCCNSYKRLSLCENLIIYMKLYKALNTSLSLFIIVLATTKLADRTNLAVQGSPFPVRVLNSSEQLKIIQSFAVKR